MDELRELVRAADGVTIFEVVPGAAEGAEVFPRLSITKTGIRISISVERLRGISGNSTLVEWEEAKKPGALLEALDSLRAAQNSVLGPITLALPVVRS